EHAAIATDHHHQVADLAERLARGGLQAMAGQHFGDAVFENHMQVTFEQEFLQAADRIEYLGTTQTTDDADIAELLHGTLCNGENCPDYGRKPFAAANQALCSADDDARRPPAAPAPAAGA